MDNMEFWGVEVKGKETSKVKVEEDHLLHLSQATLGELKKDGEPVTLYVKVGEKKLVLGVLNPKSNPQLSFDLVFEKDFEISHNWKNGSVHLLGYQSELHEEGEEFPGFSDEDEDEDIPVPPKTNGEVAAILGAPKAVAAKPKKENKPKAAAKAEEDDDSDDDEDSDDVASDEELVDMSDDSDDDDEESSEEEETPAKTESGKKRKPELKTPEPKKAKLAATPQKTDGKKGNAHTATPHPAKKGAKTPPGGDKSAPKSGAQPTCESCKKTFNSEIGLQAHTKAKHSIGK